ncbi:autotransporter assembly complex protein TamA [Methylocaldum sp. MU1018]
MRWILLLGCWLWLACAWGDEPVTVRIEGLDDEKLEENIRALLTIARPDGMSGSHSIRIAHERAPEEIRKALQPFGYYRPKIDASLTREGAGWLAVYRIDPGPAIALGEVDVRLTGEGTALPEFKTLIERFPLKRGDVLDHARYEKGKDAFSEAAAEFGFFDARYIRSEILVHLSDYRAEIHLHFDTGKRYRFGEISFPETPLKQSLLERFVNFRPGEPFRAATLVRLQKNLINSGYFSRADAIPQPEQGDGQTVPILVELEMQPKNRFQAGAGYGTDTGPRLALGYRNRYLNRQGHSFYADLRVSLIRTDLDALYAIPLKHPEKDQLGFAAQIGTEDTDAGEARVMRAGIRRSTARRSLREVLSLDLQHERFDVGEGPQTAVLLMPGVAYTWLESDDVLNPDRGARVDLIGNGAWKDVLSDVSFFKLRLNAKGIYSLGERNRLIARAQLGYIATGEFDRLPLTQRFYAGGDKSVRGYRLNEISARNQNDHRTGGRYLTVGSIEYERTLFGPWGVAAFYDVGRAANRLDEPFSHGVGVGGRWRSPIGPVRLDFAVPLSRSEDSFQVHLILGPDL